MRFVHTADLHLGRRLAQMPLEDDTRHILDQLFSVVTSRQADALVVAGDVFDNSTPSESALRQWDAFQVRMAKARVPMLVVSGNHDSGTRLGFGATFSAEKDIHVAGDLGDEVSHVTIAGTTFWLVPFVRPAEVRAWAARRGVDATQATSYDAAFALLMDHVRSLPAFAEAAANVCVAHQFVTSGGANPTKSDSERMSLGTLDNVDASAFEGFDYVALGHVHGPQRIGRDTVRYAGSPLKLSTSEVSQRKSFVLVDVTLPDASPAVAPSAAPQAHADVRVSYELVSVEPLRDFRQEKGSLSELVERGTSEPDDARQDFVAAVVTDDNAVDVMARLRHAWPNLVQVTFDNATTRSAGAAAATSQEEVGKGTAELFSEFFARQVDRELSPSEAKAVARALERSQTEGSAA